MDGVAGHAAVSAGGLRACFVVAWRNGVRIRGERGASAIDRFSLILRNGGPAWRQRSAGNEKIPAGFLVQYLGANPTGSERRVFDQITASLGADDSRAVAQLPMEHGWQGNGRARLAFGHLVIHAHTLCQN